MKDYTSVGSEFGTLDDLRALVSGAHDRNIAVILDFVANHTSWDHSWITAHPSWYVHNGSTIVSPSGFSDVAQLDFSNQDMRDALISAMRYWVFAANCDGFRFDYAAGPPVDFWKQAITSLRSISTHTLIMFAESVTVSTSGNLFSAAGFDCTFGFNFYDTMYSIYKSGANVTGIDTRNTDEYTGASSSQRVVRFLNNHDKNSPPITYFGGKTGSMAAFVVIAYMHGVPFIYNGQEVGSTQSLAFPFTSAVIDWTTSPDVTAEYKKVLTFRNSSTAVRRGTLVSYTTSDVCAFTKASGTEKVFVVSNLRNSSVSYSVDASLVGTTWNDAFGVDAPTTLAATLLLNPYEYRVLTNQ